MSDTNQVNPLDEGTTGDESGEPSNENPSPEEAIFNMLDEDGKLLTPEVEDDGSKEVTEESEETEKVEEDSEEATEEPSDDEEVVEEVEETESEETEEVYTVKIDGKETEVSGDELLNGYLRQQDYTRKTQTLAEERKADGELRVAIQQEREQYIQALEWLKNNSDNELSRFEKVNWDELKEEDPTEWQTKRIEYQEVKDRITKTQAEQQRVAELHETERKEAFNVYAGRQIETLYEQVPALKEEGERVKLRDYALSNGVSEDVLNNLVDHVSLTMLYKAMLYDSSNEKLKTVVKKKIKKDAPKFVKSGSTPTKKENKASKTKAKKLKLKKTGDLHDAADIFFDMLD
tara:strand:- start:698 stop:1738 length:1041 start_codon:yes stop_codon:yes gene_type:complete